MFFRFQVCIQPGQHIPAAQGQCSALLRAFPLIRPDILSSLFCLLDANWGPYTIDRFANDSNAQLPRFNSRFAAPGAEAIDCFTQNWAPDNSWLVPPVCLVNRCVQHLIRCCAQGTLVIPDWPSSAFWPLLFPDGLPASFVADQIRFPAAARYLVAGHQPNSVFTPERFHGSLLALRLDARLPKL